MTDQPDEQQQPRKRKRTGSVGQTIGGVLFGFEQQVLRTTPPPQELVHHARPDAPIPAGDGSLIHVGMPGVTLPADDAPGGEMDDQPGDEAGDEPDGEAPDAWAEGR